MYFDYKIKVYGKEYVSRMKDILFDLFEKNIYDKVKGISKFIYDRDEFNEEKMKEWVII